MTHSSPTWKERLRTLTHQVGFQAAKGLAGSKESPAAIFR